jgi:hypothetical protein
MLRKGQRYILQGPPDSTLLNNADLRIQYLLTFPPDEQTVIAFSPLPNTNDWVTGSSLQM